MDYHRATLAMAARTRARARAAAIDKEPRFNEHAALTVDSDFQI
ncbi:hypothetical protein RCH06_000566 [Polaromonas sp. CG_9.5]|nr:hypothetical protein [Polaromonas sp. CG_9.5]